MELENYGLRIVGMEVQNQTIDTDQGPIEGPTEYFMVVAGPTDLCKTLRVSSETYMDLHDLIGE